MAEVDPSVIIRLGTHAEKDYLEKTIQFFDGYIIAANLIEATPGATASLIVKLSGAKKGIPYYLDPMTYGFSLDLDYLKSEQKVKGRTVFDFKRSYKVLAERLGGVFATAIEDDTAITPDAFAKASTIRRTCESIVEYQLNRPGTELAGDENFADYSTLPNPAAIFAPYFYIDDDDTDSWIDLTIALAKQTAELEPGPPVHAVVCADQTFLDDDESVTRLIDELPGTGVDGVWLWFSNLNEHTASVEQLLTLRRIASELSESISVYNMHGGFYSLALSRYGMSGISHGVGYGEQKDIAPVQGQSTPTVRYYLPAVRKRLGVPDIERAFGEVGVNTVKDFFDKVCNCVVCRGAIKSLKDFQSFGELHFSSNESRRKTQTAAAAKLCRFHFLLSRIKERDWVTSEDIAGIQAELKAGAKNWGAQPSIATNAAHLRRWHTALAEADADD
jgi:hypothetical protein